MSTITLPNAVNPVFIPQKSAREALDEERQINTRASKKTLSETPDFEDELFSTTYVPENQSEIEQVLEIMRKHQDVISVTRKDSKTFQSTFLKLQQLVRGEFLYAYTWDRTWFNRVAGKFPVTDLKFDWDSLIARVNDVLDYVCERQKYGYWWPSKKNSKMAKASLSNFLAVPMKSGNWWSPFLEISCGDCVTPKMLRTSLGEKVCQKLDEILQDVWFTKDFNTMVNFYKSVVSLKRRCDLVYRGLTGEQSYYLSSFVKFLDEIRKCNLETGCVGPNFIGPWSNKWSVLKDWFRKVHEVEI
jgi:hypothetical protein